MYSESTSISCGVDMVHGFEDEEPGEDIAHLTRKVSEAMWYDAWSCHQWDDARRARLNAAVYLFSDVKGNNGDRFGQFIMGLYPTDVTCTEAVNPNSGNTIVTYMWRIGKGLSKLPGWSQGKKDAARSFTSRSRHW